MFRLMKCEVCEAKDGVEGEAIALELQPDLVLLDIMMPNQDGYETCICRAPQALIAQFDVRALSARTSAPAPRGSALMSYLQKPITRGNPGATES